MTLSARAPLLCMAFLAIAPLLSALDEKEIKITLYINQVWGSGPTANQAVVVQGYNNTRFGQTVVLDWAVRDGPDPSSAKLIGRAQGFDMMASQIGVERWPMAMNLVFSDASRYSGSTLQMLGILHRGKDLGLEWSIVGGTGELTMARGVAKYTFEKINDPLTVYKVNVHAYYTSVDSTAVYANGGCNSKISEPIVEKTIM